MVLQYFTEENANDAVLARLANCSNPRLREVMESVTRHLLEVVREVKPTPAEWFQAIQFLAEYYYSVAFLEWVEKDPEG